ncbi:MAG TPA: Smr/MutS family protein [Candidimonas sp.]|nr:Smr/MutS family protein [Candidimonas sp.]
MRPDKGGRAGALDDDDIALFRRAVRDVQPITHARRASSTHAHETSAATLRARRAFATGSESQPLVQLSDHYSPAIASEDDTSYVQYGYGPDLILGLKRGKWDTRTSLDLHGATLDQARERLDTFLQSCLTHRIRCVRIVHGKGYGSPNGQAILKQTVRRWLAQMRDVLAYAECSEQDGGAGAVRVLLRARPLV